MVSSNLSFCRIECFSPTLQPIGSGPISNITSLSITQAVNRIGELKFTVPLGDDKTNLLQPGVIFDVYLEKLGDCGRWYFQNKRVTGGSGIFELEVTAYDSLYLLTRQTVGRRQYQNKPISSVVSEIAGLAGFQTSLDVSGNTFMSTAFESPLKVLDNIRDNGGYSYRLGWDSTNKIPIFELGNFGKLSPYYLENYNGVIQSQFLLNRNNAIITSLTENEDAQTIVNRVIILGAGSDQAQLDIAGVTGEYPVLSAKNPDGSFYYYVQDDKSIEKYGLFERVLTFPNIRPLSNGFAAINAAKHALYLAGVNYLKKHLEPRYEYNLDVIKLGPNIRPGDKVTVRYVENRNDVNYLSVHGQFYVLEINRQFDTDGTEQARLVISTINNRRSSDVDLVAQVVDNLNSIQLHTPIQTAYSETNYFLRLRGDANPANRINGTAVLRLKNEVTFLLRSIMRLETQPLKSSAAGKGHRHKVFHYVGDAEPPVSADWQEYFAVEDAAGSGVVNAYIPITSLPRNKHLYTFEADGVDNITYGVFENTGVYVGGIGIIINGNDVTSDLGGPFGTDDAATIQELDITPYIEAAGVQGEHIINFYATSGLGELNVTIDNLLAVQPLFLS